MAKSVEEVSTLFSELALLTVEQSATLERIENNCDTAEKNTRAGATEVAKANVLQKSIRTKLCLCVLLLLVLAALAVLVLKVETSRSTRQ